MEGRREIRDERGGRRWRREGGGKESDWRKGMREKLRKDRGSKEESSKRQKGGRRGIKHQR